MCAFNKKVFKFEIILKVNPHMYEFDKGRHVISMGTDIIKLNRNFFRTGHFKFTVVSRITFSSQLSSLLDNYRSSVSTYF